MSEFDQADNAQPTQASNEESPTSWQASEYIHNEKDTTWYVVFGLVFVSMLVGMYLLLNDILSLVVIALGGVAIVVYANRPPRSISYKIGNDGITIDDRHYDFDSFRSFALVDDQAVQYIMLSPIERLMPAITIYVDPEQIDTITDRLGNFVPYTEHRPDAIDRLTRKIRF